MAGRLVEAAARAEHILEAARQAHPPTDLEKVASLWPRLQVSTEDLDKAGYLIDLGELGATVVLRRSDSEARRRFTLAHEFGHLALARSACLADLPEEFRKPSGALAERWCDAFAAHLLMPPSWILADLRKVTPSDLHDWLRRAAQRYRVSQNALRFRVAELTAISLFEAQLSERSSDVKIVHRYDSARISSVRLSNTIQDWREALRGSHGFPKTYYWEEHRLLSVHRSFHERGRGTGWLVCLIPPLAEQVMLQKPPRLEPSLEPAGR